MTEQERYLQAKESLTEQGQLLYAARLLERAARLFPETIAVIISEQEKISYRELFAAACAISNHLATSGIQPGDKVMILYENSIQFYKAYYGAWQTGAIVVPVNVFLHENEVSHIIQDADPALIFVSDAQAPKISPTYTKTIISAAQLEEIVQNPSPQPFTVQELPRDEMCALLYTSGTTGVPKGVMLSSNNIMINIIQGVARFNFTGHERIYCALPLFHSFTQNTCVWASTACGVTVILVPTISRTTLLAACALAPTIVLGVPGLFALFCRLKASFSAVRYFISGGDALPDKIRMYFELVYGRKICNGYGLSETSPFVSVDFDDVIEPTSNVGKPMIGIEYQIRDTSQDGEHLIGVLWLKGPNIMLGYYQAPEATAAVLHDGWFNTGDLAYIDKRGKIVICGREKDLIAHKGIKIYPQEIENLLMAHPQVMMAAVIGVKNSLEEYPVAYIVLKEPLATAAQILHTYCTQHLAAYKIPRQFIIVENLPLTPTGKIDKKELKKNHTA